MMSAVEFNDGSMGTARIRDLFKVIGDLTLAPIPSPAFSELYVVSYSDLSVVDWCKSITCITSIIY